MTDLVDYVLNASPELSSHPRWSELETALTVDVLDYADQCLRLFRERDRLADAMADERWKSWSAEPVDRTDLSPGQRIVIHDRKLLGYEVQAVVAETPAYARRDVWTGAEPLFCYPNGERDLWEILGRDAEILRWVPIPIDGATLGTRPSTAVHRA